MYLKIVETSQKIVDPSNQEIAKAVITSPGGPCTGVILQSDGKAFMQTTSEADKGYALEYLDEDSGILFHYRWITTTADVVKAMQSYACGDDWWKNAFPWEYWGVVYEDNFL